MKEKDIKSKLYKIISKYISKSVNGIQFSLQFQYIYNNELNYNNLSINERSAFLEIALMTEKVLSRDKRSPEDKNDIFFLKKLHDLIAKTKLVLPIEFIVSELSVEDYDLETFNHNQKVLKHKSINGFKRSDKRRLYELIQLYFLGQIDEILFCNEFYYCYDLELEDELSDLEETTFNELSVVSGRFSPFQEDHNTNPGAYYTVEELHQQILEAKKVLQSNFIQSDPKTIDEIQQ